MRHRPIKVFVGLRYLKEGEGEKGRRGEGMESTLLISAKSDMDRRIIMVEIMLVAESED